MATKARFIIAESSIRAFFNNSKKKVFSDHELTAVFNEKRILWNLPIAMTPEEFINQLKREIIKPQEITFESYIDKKLRYTVEGFSVFQLAASLINRSYLSHYSAVYLHGLTTQVPKTIYITFEQAQKRNTDRTLEQAAIDKAFSQPQRKTGAKGVYEDYTFVIHNGMFTGRQGITQIDNLPLTDIERTLIDIMVRPNYSGGVDAVLHAYRKAAGRISLNKLIAILDNINFIYPYHQSLGFYLERAGYQGKKLQELEEREKPLTFHLAYNMPEKDYSKRWNLYYPKGR